MLISVIYPDDMDFDGMRRMAGYFFPDMRAVERGGKKKGRGQSCR